MANIYPSRTGREHGVRRRAVGRLLRVGPNGLIVVTNGSAADEAALIAAGCTVLYPLTTLSLPVFTVAALPAAVPAGQASFVSDSSATLAADTRRHRRRRRREFHAGLFRRCELENG